MVIRPANLLNKKVWIRYLIALEDRLIKERPRV